MSVTLAAVKGRVQGRLRDLVAKGGTFGQIEYDQAICDAYLYVQSRLPAASALLTTAFTISAGGDTFSLPTTISQYGSADFDGGTTIQLRSNRQFLRKRTVEEIDALRNQNPTTFLGVPIYYALWEDKTQAVQGRCYPGAVNAEACDLFVRLSADDLRDYVGGGSSTMENVSVNLSRIGATALVYHAAAELMLAMPDDERKRRNINPQVALSWQRQAGIMLYQEAKRHSDLEDAGRTMRWVS